MQTSRRSSAPSDFVIVATPLRSEEDATPEYRDAIASNIELPHTVLAVVGKPVDVARDELAIMAQQTARELRAGNTGMRVFVAWIDDDSWWPRGTLGRLVSTLKARSDLQIVCGYYGKRVPCSVANVSHWPKGVPHTGHLPNPLRERKPEYLVPVVLAGMNLVVHPVELLDALGPNPFTLDGTPCGSEDGAFFHRAQAIGAKAVMDIAAVVAHCDSGVAYIPNVRPGRIVDGEFVTIPDDRTDDEIKNAASTRPFDRWYDLGGERKNHMLWYNE